MKFKLFSLLLLLVGTGLQAQVQFTTENPRTDDINDPDVLIKRVELTAQYTIIYMKFQAKRQGSAGQPWPFSIPAPGGGNYGRINTSNIGFEPTARLYVNQGEKSYKFIRAENIPLEMRREVQPGERVDFIAYFERIDPGYATFDLYECKDSRGTICFNFWGVHIVNPKRKEPSPQQTPKPQTPITPNAPKPQPPRYTPRTKPGVGVDSAEEAPKPKPVQPQEAPVNIAINGVTRDAKTKQPVIATVAYHLLAGAEASNKADSVQSANSTGKYRIPVNRRGVYVLTTSAKGYFSQSDTLATNRVDVARDFDLKPIEAGTKITLENIYFNVSKYDLKSESFPELDRLAGVMKDNPTMQIRLEGHTDTVGEFDANVTLSRNRVNEVKRYLVGKGISAGRIETIGYGPSRPINTNKSLKERPENRRVEMVIVKA